MDTSQLSRVTLSWRNLGVSVPLQTSKQQRKEAKMASITDGKPLVTEKQILASVAGLVEPGQLLAIMGPSGSGKTTLLNILSGRIDGAMRVEGDILINGSAMEKKHRRLIGYVRQSDVHFNNLTVREILAFSANMRLPGELSEQRRQERIEKIVKQLGLGKCADTIVGGNLIRGISGGEKKRLSVGVELITSPSLLFLDEPTSGLDSHMAYNLFEHLNVLKTTSNCTIVTTIHQPSSKLFADFDLLLLLSEGRVFYFGPIKEAVDYFASRCRLKCPVYSNPAEYFLDVASLRLHPSMDLGYPEKDEVTGAPLTPITWDDLVCIYERVRQEQVLESIEAARVRCLAEQQVLQDAFGGMDTLRKGSKFSKSFSKFSIMDRQAQQLDHSRNGTAHSGEPEVTVAIEPVESVEMTSQGASAGASADASAELNLPSDQTYARSLVSQFIVLARRSFISFLRDKRYFRARIIQVTIMALLIGVIFFRLPYTQGGISARAGAIFFLMIQVGISPMMNILHVFHAEREVVSHERDGKWYGVFAYYGAKSVTELPFQLLEPILFTCISYWLIGLNPSADRFFTALGLLMLTALCGSSFGLMLASSTPSFQVATIFASLMMMILLLFSGFFILNDLIPVWLRWIKYISFVYYGFQLLIHNEFKDGTFYCDPSELTVNGTCPITTGDRALVSLGANDINVAENVIIMFVLVLAARTVSFLSLRFYRPKGQH